MIQQWNLSRYASGIIMLTASLIALSTWAFTSPVGSDPDGSFHLNSIWCGQGIRAGLCEDPPPGQEDTNPKTIQTPVGIALAGTCYAFRNLDSAACEELTINETSLTPNQLNNQGRLYPNGYYWVASHLVGDNIEFSAIAVRVMNVLLLVGLMVLLRNVADAAVYRAVLVSMVVMWLPLGYFLVASNNGSSWTVTGVGVFWAFFWTALRTPVTSRLITGSLGAAASAAMAAGSRADGAMYVALVSAVVLFMVWPEVPTLRHRWLGVTSVLVLTVVGMLTYLTSGQSGSLSNGLSGGVKFGRSVTEVMWTNSLRLPGYFLGIFGIGGYGSGLGWLDTPTETITWGLMVAVLAGLVARSTTPRSMRHRLGLGTLIAVSVALPMYMLLLDRAIVIQNVQTRYLLPLLTVVFAVFVLPVMQTRNPWSLTGVSRGILVLSITVAHSAAMHVNMRRYVSGFDVASPNLNVGREWWPHWLPSPNICWFLGSVSVGVVAYLCFRDIAEGAGRDANADEQTHLPQPT